MYSARCSSGTAQSSTKETGFPSSFIDIMMLRPEVRTSVIAVCKLGSSTSTTPPHFAPLLSKPKPRSPINSLSRLQPAEIFLLIVLAEFDQQHRVRRAAHELLPASAGTSRSRRASSIMVRSTSSTAIGASLTRCCAASIAS